MSNRKKVLIVEPSLIIVEGLMKILGDCAHLEMLIPLHDIECLKGRVITGKPDVLLVNPTLLPQLGHHTFSSIMQDYPNTAIVGIVYQYVEHSLLRMCQAVVDIREERGRVSEILLESYSALKPVNESIDDNSYELTKRELDVLVHIAKGLMNKEIAEKLNISIHTVISHRKNITRKTNIKSVAGLAMYALMNNLMEEGAL